MWQTVWEWVSLQEDSTEHHSAHMDLKNGVIFSFNLRTVDREQASNIYSM